MSFIDNATAVVFVMIFAVVILISAFVMNAWNTNPEVASWGGTATVVGTNANSALLAFDGLIVLIMIGIVITTIISAMFIQSHPVYFIILFLVQGFLVIFSRVVGDVYLDIVATPQFASIAASFPLTTLLFTHIQYIALMSIVMSGIVMYAKRAMPNAY